MMKQIHADTIMSFGKYRGRDVTDVLVSDPAYFHWCRCAGVATLMGEVAEVVDEWVAEHPGEARRTENSANVVKKRGEVEVTHTPTPHSKPGASTPIAAAVAPKPPVTTELPTPPKPVQPVQRPQDWGMW